MRLTHRGARRRAQDVTSGWLFEDESWRWRELHRLARAGGRHEAALNLPRAGARSPTRPEGLARGPSRSCSSGRAAPRLSKNTLSRVRGASKLMPDLEEREVALALLGRRGMARGGVRRCEVDLRLRRRDVDVVGSAGILYSGACRKPKPQSGFRGTPSEKMRPLFSSARRGL